LSLLNTETPSLAGAKRVSVGEIWRASPLAVVATLASGMGQSAFFAMGAVYGLMQGLSLPYVSIMMALPPLGVILSQFPAGLLSDRYDRRSIILILAALTVMIAALSIIAGQTSPEALIALMTLFGTIALPLYSLVIAHANDHLEREQMLGASGKLILLYGLGAIFGPLVVGQFMSKLGSAGFMAFMMVCYGTIAGFAFWRRLKKPENLKAKADDVIRVGPVTTPVAAQAVAESGTRPDA
jgi:MFS family permease